MKFVEFFNCFISNGIVECKMVYGVVVLLLVEEMSKFVFIDVGVKKVKCLLFGEDVLIVEVLFGIGIGG